MAKYKLGGRKTGVDKFLGIPILSIHESKFLDNYRSRGVANAEDE